MIERLRVIERNLLPAVLVATVVALLAPGIGDALSGLITPLLALLMLCVSLSFDAAALRMVLARPGVQALATALVYGPMSLAAYALGGAVFGASALALGVVLVGTLPTDVSSPLMVLVARGNVALATVLNAVNTALAPVLVPGLFLLYTGVSLDVPAAALVVELAVVVLVPTAVGVALRTRLPDRIAPLDPALSAVGSLCYLALLLAVVGPNAGTVLGAPATAARIVGVALALNLLGYALGALTRPLLRDPADQTAMLFTVSKKEFTIAAFVVAASGLPEEVALPAAVYAVVQMVTAPVAARALAGRQQAGHHP